jgi:signal transduction histidine kinase/CheY-like chemotaxis protein
MAVERTFNERSGTNQTRPWVQVARIVEISLPLLIIILVILSWFIAHHYQQTLVDTVIASYQETQLELVRSVARSIGFFVEDRVAHGLTIDAIEQQIFRRFVAPIHLLQSGDAWIYAPGHVVFDLSSDFPAIYRGKSMGEIFDLQKEKGAAHYEAMSTAVAQAREGIGWYVWLPDKGREIASWTPVRFENHVWTIGLSTPLQEILQATGAQRRGRLIYALMALATFLGGSLSLTALWGFRHRRHLHQAAEQHNRELRALVADLETEVGRRRQSEAAAKEAEEERQRLSEQLMHAQKMEAIGALAGGVAHDLNNILSGIISYPELLLARLPADSPLIGPLQTIQTSGERAASIVQDLLTMARRGIAQKQVIDLNTVIHEYLQSPAHRKQALQHPNVRVTTQLDASLMHLMGSPADLTKIVMNLVINALESFKGPGAVTITTGNRYIDGLKIGTMDIREGEYVHLKVADTGSGIGADDLPRIFEPFYTKKHLGMSGSGLGLAVVWGTVQDHFGAIDVHSTPGKGTVFDVYLPATRQDLPLPIDQVAKELLMAKGESVLVVDDSPLQRDIAQRILEMLGYRVQVVDSGEAAVAYLEKHTVDLVVLDMIMGEGMDGLDTYRAISALHPGQKAIIASGFAETDRVRKAQQLGAGAYVKKPFLMETLALAIRQELDY